MRSLTRYAEQAKKLPSWLYKAGAQAYYDKRFPRHLFLETTAACDLSCSYCPREKVGNSMEFNMFKEIIEEASLYGPRSFSLHLFGEPLLWKRLTDGISYIKQRNKQHVVLLTTNGTRLNVFAKDLIKLKVDEIIWSWRTEAKFTEETKRRLRESTIASKTIFRVRILLEVTPKEEIKRWSSWPKVEIRSLHNYGGNIDTKKLTGKSIVVPPKRWPCYHLWMAPAVSWNGNHLLCCADPHQKEILGTFPRMSITEAFVSMETKRREHLDGKFKGICKDCNVWTNYPNMHFSWQYS